MSTLLSVNSYHHRRDGSEVVYLEHNRIFARAGWNVVPFAMQHPRNEPTEWSTYFPPATEFDATASLAEQARLLPRILYSRQARRSLGRLIEQARPDLAHCHSIYHHLSPAVLDELRSRDVPVVMSLHDLKVACPAYLMYTAGDVCQRCRGGALRHVVAQRCIKDSLALSTVAWAEAQLHRVLDTYRRGVDRFVSPSAFYIDTLVAWGWDRSLFVHIPNVVDTGRLTPSFRPGQAFLYFGRLSAEKGLRTLLRAAAEAAVPLRLAGDGPLRAELEEQADNLEIDVTFLGRLEGPELWREVAAARATVLPSEWFENAPMAVLESYAMGTPVIGTTMGGIPELVDDETGWLVPARSAGGLAAALREAATTEDDDIERRGRAARRRAETDYSVARYQQRMTCLYRDLGVVGTRDDGRQP